ncbi:uncharacterized mitochondrial protein AtMg00810-like [Phaseolus vulgaris]|uniref:uncharacterized mitochondrial protein AtMg00810-like n=1 Tax=Phaseolus vulgaris TaxID=3885 RepID=UPI0035CBC34B
MGFSSSKSDISLFTRFTTTDTLFLLIYVDDILVTGNSKNLVQDFIQRLSYVFALKDLGTETQGLRLYSSSSYFVVGFSDSNWATDLDDRKSTSSYCIYVGRNLISWSSKKQKVVSRSSTEVEYRSVAAALANII